MESIVELEEQVEFMKCSETRRGEVGGAEETKKRKEKK